MEGRNTLPKKTTANKKLIVWRVKKVSRNVADPDPGSGAFLNPGTGMGKKSRSGSGMNIPDHIP